MSCSTSSLTFSSTGSEFSSTSSSSESSEDFPEGEDGAKFYSKMSDEFLLTEPYWYSDDVWKHSDDMYLSRKIEKNQITILSFNVWFENYNVNSRMVHLVEAVKTLNPDFICLQELTPPILKLIVELKWMRRYYVTDTTGETLHRYGNAIFSKYKFHEIAYKDFENSEMGRKVLLSTFITDRGPQITLGTFHLESFPQDADKREVQLQIFRQYTEDRSHVILCGDTNFVSDDEDEPLRPRFADAWQTLYQSTPEEKEENPGYTYDTTTNLMAARTRANSRQKRLDRCFYTHETVEPLTMEIVGSKPFRKSDMTYISDHFGIFMRMKILPQETENSNE